MVSLILAAFIFLIHGNLLSFADLRVNLTPSAGQSNCGETISVSQGNETTVYASGNVPNGHCSVYFRAVKIDGHVCDKFCVTLRTVKFNVCYVKLKFTAINFDNKKDQTKKIDCWDAVNDVWCPEAKKLQLDVLESDHYYYEFDPKNGYDFSVDIEPVCSPEKTRLVNSASNFNQKNEDRMRQIKIEGTVAGVCLALIFLVLLVVLYIYYKSKPTNNIPEETSGKSNRGSVFVNMKARLMGRRKSNVVCSEETFDDYQQVKQTDEEDADEVNENTANKTVQDRERETCSSSV